MSYVMMVVRGRVAVIRSDTIDTSATTAQPYLGSRTLNATDPIKWAFSIPTGFARLARRATLAFPFLAASPNFPRWETRTLPPSSPRPDLQPQIAMPIHTAIRPYCHGGAPIDGANSEALTEEKLCRWRERKIPVTSAETCRRHDLGPCPMWQRAAK